MVVKERTVYYLYFECNRRHCDSGFCLKTVPDEQSRAADAGYAPCSWDSATLRFAISGLMYGLSFDQYSKIFGSATVASMSRYDYDHLKRIFFVEATYPVLQELMDTAWVEIVDARPPGTPGARDRVRVATDGAYSAPTTGKTRGGHSRNVMVNFTDVASKALFQGTVGICASRQE